ncbi:MAG: hypothetical protein JW917_02625 [Ignavibacteria bacterium]|nr:hypothetical protein [Ignavibacteria bacterium]
MKNLFYIILFIVPLIFYSCSKEEPMTPEDSQIVYVCTSYSATTYHTDRNCPRLKKCSADIFEVTRRKARENGRIICSDCRKRDENKAPDTVK